MKKIVLFLLLLSVSLASAENLYLHDNLELQLDVQGRINLLAQGTDASIKLVKTELLLYPQNSFRQKILNWNSNGTTTDSKLTFNWTDKKIERKTYRFQTTIKTENKRKGITSKIPFPIKNITGLEQYTAATKNIDKNNPQIIAHASKLAEGEDDLFKVVFKLAKWVESNVNYELNTLTAETSQKASWVLQNRQGVCDEMTSLFIAMARSLGIPARFVSGISYTTSDLFTENWLPHGWAEVYFPGHGWTGFDITFGEYGYADVTHIKLRAGFDPAEASTKFEWLANKVKLTADKLNFSVQIKNKGPLSKKEISLTQKILGKRVGFGSYNVIKGTVQNKKNYYLATTLQLAVPKEVNIISSKKKVILLQPQETKDVYWLFKVSRKLSDNYWYEFPLAIYSEKNVTIQGKFKAVKNGVHYSKKEAESWIVKTGEEKKYTQQTNLTCQYQQEIKIGEEKEISCTLKNTGNTNLNQINFCLANVCKIINLAINQQQSSKIKVKSNQAGWQKVLATAQNKNINKKHYIEYIVSDPPNITLHTKSPKKVAYNKEFKIFLNLSGGSFSLPQNVSLTIKGIGFEKQWGLTTLDKDRQFQVTSNSKGLGKNNKFRIALKWQDKNGQSFKEEKTISIKTEGNTIKEKLIIWFNSIINIVR